MKRILSLTLTLMLLISGLCCAMAESVTLDAWQNEAGWTSFLASSHSPGQRFSAGIMCLSAHFGKPRISSRPSDSAWLPFS